jgi:uncharacterized membrane protein YdjX (TVP38/TMEM64 family)
VAAALIAVAVALPSGSSLLSIADRLRGAGLAGALAFIGLYAIAVNAFFPASILTLIAGFAYGPIAGLLVVAPAAALAASLAFVLARTVLRQPVERRLAAWPRMRAVDRAIAADTFRIVLLLRLSPVLPFNVLNLALGVSAARFGAYVAATFLGILPVGWLYLYLGSLGSSVAELRDAGRQGGAAHIALLAIGLTATLVAVIVVTRAARRALERELGD